MALGPISLRTSSGGSRRLKDRSIPPASGCDASFLKLSEEFDATTDEVIHGCNELDLPAPLAHCCVYVSPPRCGGHWSWQQRPRGHISVNLLRIQGTEIRDQNACLLPTLPASCKLPSREKMLIRLYGVKETSEPKIPVVLVADSAQAKDGRVQMPVNR